MKSNILLNLKINYENINIKLDDNLSKINKHIDLNKQEYLIFKTNQETINKINTQNLENNEAKIKLLDNKIDVFIDKMNENLDVFINKMNDKLRAKIKDIYFNNFNQLREI